MGILTLDSIDAREELRQSGHYSRQRIASSSQRPSQTQMTTLFTEKNEVSFETPPISIKYIKAKFGFKGEFINNGSSLLPNVSIGQNSEWNSLSSQAKIVIEDEILPKIEVSIKPFELFSMEGIKNAIEVQISRQIKSVNFLVALEKDSCFMQCEFTPIEIMSTSLKFNGLVTVKVGLTKLGWAYVISKGLQIRQIFTFPLFIGAATSVLIHVGIGEYLEYSSESSSVRLSIAFTDAFYKRTFHYGRSRRFWLSYSHGHSRSIEQARKALELVLLCRERFGSGLQGIHGLQNQLNLLYGEGRGHSYADGIEIRSGVWRGLYTDIKERGINYTMYKIAKIYLGS